MLIYSSLVVTIIISLSFSTAADPSQDPYYGKKDSHNVHNSLTLLIKSKQASPYNIKSDKDESTLLIPKIKTHLISQRKRNIRKNPKRTIQRIIKKARKNKKAYLNQMFLGQITSTPKLVTPDESKETTSTTQTTQKKKMKMRKFNSKYVRYPMPFQKLAVKKDMHHKNKREVEDRDIYILEDFDEIEFMSNENDVNSIKAHVKKYW